MSLTWQGNNQIKTSQGIPLSSHGPALVTKDKTLFMVYVGKGGKNIWQSTTQVATSSNWNTNLQVTIAGQSAPLSSYRPALALFNNNIHMVYVSQFGASLWWSWFDGVSWHGNLQLPWSGGDPQPALAVHNGKLRLVWHDHQPATSQNSEHNFIHYSALDAREPLQVSSWEQPVLLGDGGEQPALASYNGSLYMVLTAAVSHGNPPTTLNGMLIGKWQNVQVAGQQQDVAWHGWNDFKIVGSAPLSAGGVAMAVHNNLLYIVYRGQLGANMLYAYIDTLDVIAGNIQIKTASVPETSAALGLIDFQGNLCLAYKGESSNNLWYAHAS